jgi:biopolymer transport protein ExbD
VIRLSQKKRRFAPRRRRHGINWLNPVPMIDVVFLLLIFFILSANLHGNEGFLPAILPQTGLSRKTMEMEPLLIYLNSRPDGSCQVQVGRIESFVVQSGVNQAGFQVLGDRLSQILTQQGRRLDDPVKLAPDWNTRWDDVVKAYDALWRINLTNIIFAVVEPQ